MADIYHQVLIDAPVEEIYRAITTQEGLSQWWLKDCLVKPEVGFVNIFRLPNGITNKMKVAELNKNEYVQWDCLNEANAWSGTKVMFEISTKGELGCLDFRHKGYKRPNQFYATCNYHWARHLSMLKAYCETGEDQVYEEREKKEVENVEKVHKSAKDNLNKKI